MVFGSDCATFAVKWYLTEGRGDCTRQTTKRVASVSQHRKRWVEVLPGEVPNGHGSRGNHLLTSVNKLRTPHHHENVEPEREAGESVLLENNVTTEMHGFTGALDYEGEVKPDDENEGVCHNGLELEKKKTMRNRWLSGLLQSVIRASLENLPAPVGRREVEWSSEPCPPP